MNAPTRITPEEKARLTDSACHLFMARNPEFFPCQANSERLISFVHSQLGMTIDDFPYPITVEQWQAAYDHIVRTAWFYARPEEEPNRKTRLSCRERHAQQKVRDDFDARQRADQTERDRNYAAERVGKNRVGSKQGFPSTARAKSYFRFVRPGLESRHVEQVKLGIPAQARVNVGLAHPELSPKSGEFSKLCAAEVVRFAANSNSRQSRAGEMKMSGFDNQKKRIANRRCAVFSAIINEGNNV